MDRRAMIVVCLLLVGAVVAVAIGAQDTGDSRPPPDARARAATAAVQRATASAAARRAARSDARVVDAALRHVTVVRRGTPLRREVALTFDDGPSPFTGQIVRRLRLMRVPGTFFTVGLQLQRFPDEVATVVRAGFPVEDHTVNHRSLAHLPRPGQLREIRGDARRLVRLGVPAPRLFRPPYGAFDRTTEAVARSLGMLVVMWTVDSRDYTRPGRKAIVHTVLSGIRPGAIVLMHDGGGDRAQTLKALPAIVRGVRRRGYRLVTVPQLLRPRGMPLRGGWNTGA
jgi:peptidoglycan/xylan/chitin deacetylase (PgdA/CDA1 family)